MKNRLFLLWMILLTAGALGSALPGVPQGFAEPLLQESTKKGADLIQPPSAWQRPPVALPCLVAENLQFQPANPKSGDQATFSFNIKNIGTAPANPVQVLLYSLPKPFQVPSFNTPILAPGQSQAYAFKAQLNDDSMGVHTIGVDYNLYMPTIKMAPGCPPTPYKVPATINVSITPDQAFKPDLIISSVGMSPANPTRNGMIIFTVQVKNIGPKPSTEGYLNFFLDGLSNYDTAKLFDSIVGGVPGQNVKVPPLPKDKVHNAQIKRINPTILLDPGNHCISASVLQSQNLTDEISIMNNNQKYCFQVADIIEDEMILKKPEMRVAPVPRPGPPPVIGPGAPIQKEPLKAPAGR